MSGKLPVEKWSEENHAMWKEAANREIPMLFRLLKRANVSWDKMDEEQAEKIDKGIVNRLKSLRTKSNCPESLLYLGWAMDQFYNARKSQSNLGEGAKVDPEVQVVYERIMDTLFISGQYKCAKESHVPYAGARPRFLVDMENRFGLTEESSFAEKRRAFYEELKRRKVAK